VATGTTADGNPIGKFDFWMEGFEVARASEAKWYGFVLFEWARVDRNVVPNNLKARLHGRCNLSAIMLGLSEDFSPRFGGHDGRWQRYMAGGTIFQVKLLPKLEFRGNWIDEAFWIGVDDLGDRRGVFIAR
jgi:hypothetical protein